MMRDYLPLTGTLLQNDVTYLRPLQVLPERVKLDNAALYVMTDFKQVAAATIDANVTMETANAVMIKRGVRLLLVVEREVVTGIITATDILGEKPLKLIQERGITHDEIMVSDIMTPRERLEVINFRDVMKVKVGHVVATLKKAGRQHAVVVEVDEAGKQVLRGLFSATQIARQLGVQIRTTEVARTFAEIEAILNH